MKIYLINETPSDIQVHARDGSTAIQPNGGQMFDIAVPDKLSIDKGIVVEPNQDGTVATTDDDQQLCGIGGEFLAKYGVPDSADHAFAVVQPGDGDGDDEEDDEATLIDLVTGDLSEHGFKVAEIEDGIFMAQDGNGNNVMLREQAQGILFQSGIKTRKLDEADFGTLFVYMNSFNNGSLLTKAFMPHAEFTAVSFECWLPPAYSPEMFEHFFSIYLSEIKVNFDEELREQMDEFLLR